MPRSLLRVVTLNILTPELLCYFWRSSHGLPLLPDQRDYLGALPRRRKECLALASPKRKGDGGGPPRAALLLRRVVGGPGPSGRGAVARARERERERERERG